MSFTLEVSKTGKDCIVYDKHKYRESYHLKNGDIVWRCLGRTCKASIKTSSDKCIIFSSNDAHSGPHPVTLRALTPTQTQPRRDSMADDPENPQVPPPQPEPLTPSSTPITTRSTANASQPMDSPPLEQNITAFESLEAENAYLKNKLEQVQEQLRCVLDHTVENDARLLQYTNEIFSSGTPCSLPVLSEPEHRMTVDCATQCDLDSGKDQQLVDCLRTTVQVLEAEVECLRSEAVNRVDSCAWTLVSKKKGNKITSCNKLNRPAIPEVTSRKENRVIVHTEYRETRGKEVKGRKKDKKIIALKKENSYNPVPSTLMFNATVIESDSHGRHLTALFRELVDTRTACTVSGTCKPGAGLLDVVSPNPLPHDSCSIIIAGTNDIAAGRPEIIYKNLKRMVMDRLGTGKVVLSTVPARHDLPAHHPIHGEVDRINRFIRRIAYTSHNTVILDFNSIPRSLFTQHGMHLRMSGKKMLAKKLLNCLIKLSSGMSDTAGTASSGLAPLTPPTPSVSVASPEIVEPRTLPYETYAEALRSPLAPPNGGVDSSKNQYFLGPASLTLNPRHLGRVMT